MTDPIADMLTRIRNATIAKHTRVDIPASTLKLEIARILEGERHWPVSSRKVARCASSSVLPAPGPATTQALRLARTAAQAACSSSSTADGRHSSMRTLRIKYPRLRW